MGFFFRQGKESRRVGVHAPTRGITRTANRSRVVFEGMEVRAVRDLSQVDESTLRAKSKEGFAARDIIGNSLQLHHLDQIPAGPLVEIPITRHKIARTGHGNV